MIKTALADIQTGKPIHAISVPVNGQEFHLLTTTTVAEAFGSFKSATRTTAGTTIVTSPPNEGSIILTDYIVTSDRKNAATVTMQITDGVNTIVVLSPDVTDAPVNLTHAFKGLWRGWKNARVELVTTGAVIATLSVGYYKVKSGLGFEEWDALR